MNRYVKQLKRQIIPLILVLLLLGVLAPLRSLILQRLVDAPSVSVLGREILFGFVFCLVVFVLEKSSRDLHARVLERLSFLLRRDITKSLFSRSIRDFRGDPSSEYVSILQNDVRTIVEEHYSPWYDIALYGVFFLTAFITFILIDPLLLIVVLVVSIPQILIPKKIAKPLGEGRLKYSNSLAGYMGRLKDFLTGFEVIKGYAAESTMQDRLEEKNRDLAESRYVKDKVLFFAQALISVVGHLSFVLTVGAMAYLVLKGRMSFGYLIASTQMMNFITVPAQTISRSLARIKGTEPIVEKLAPYLEDRKESPETELIHSSTPLQLSEGITLQNLSFSYGDKVVLDHINYHFEVGKKYAIIGPSGCGKSTLLQLILGYYHDFTGDILFDKHSLHTIDSRTIALTCPMIHQQVVVFQDSIRNNITLYQPFEESDIQRAIQRGGIESFVSSFPEKENHMLLESGGNLSGGEKQRISIARALIREPSILLLDEATSGLDNQKAFEIENDLLQISDLTVIAITHRHQEELLAQYDDILMLEGGKLVSQK